MAGATNNGVQKRRRSPLAGTCKVDNRRQKAFLLASRWQVHI